MKRKVAKKPAKVKMVPAWSQKVFTFHDIMAVNPCWSREEIRALLKAVGREKGVTLPDIAKALEVARATCEKVMDAAVSTLGVDYSRPVFKTRNGLRWLLSMLGAEVEIYDTSDRIARWIAESESPRWNRKVQAKKRPLLRLQAIRKLAN